MTICVSPSPISPTYLSDDDLDMLGMQAARGDSVFTPSHVVLRLLAELRMARRAELTRREARVLGFAGRRLLAETEASGAADEELAAGLAKLSLVEIAGRR